MTLEQLNQLKDPRDFMLALFPEEFAKFERIRGACLTDRQIGCLFTAIWEYRMATCDFSMAEWWREQSR